MANAELCWICEKPGTEEDPLTADHLVEVAAGGGNLIENLAPCHRSCNGRRGVQFRETRGFGYERGKNA